MPVNERLHPLRGTGRKFAPPLHFGEFGFGRASSAETPCQDVGSRHGILNCQIDSHSADG